MCSYISGDVPTDTIVLLVTQMDIKIQARMQRGRMNPTLILNDEKVNIHIKKKPQKTLIVCCTSWHLMYALIVCLTSLHLKIVLSSVQHLILAMLLQYLLSTGNRLTQQLLMIGTWFYEHLYCSKSKILFLLLLTNFCQSLWIKSSAKCQIPKS